MYFHFHIIKSHLTLHLSRCRLSVNRSVNESECCFNCDTKKKSPLLRLLLLRDSYFSGIKAQADRIIE